MTTRSSILKHRFKFSIITYQVVIEQLSVRPIPYWLVAEPQANIDEGTTACRSDMDLDPQLDPLQDSQVNEDQQQDQGQQQEPRHDPQQAPIPGNLEPRISAETLGLFQIWDPPNNKSPGPFPPGIYVDEDGETRRRIHWRDASAEYKPIAAENSATAPASGANAAAGFMVKLPGITPLRLMPAPSMVIRVLIDRKISLGVPWIANREALIRRNQSLDPDYDDVKVVDFIHKHISPFQKLHGDISAGRFVCHKWDVLIIEGWRDCQKRWDNKKKYSYPLLTTKDDGIEDLWPWIHQFVTVCIL